MSKLRISSSLSLPLDFVTQSQAILAKKRVGKSYTASVQAEELLKAGQQIAVIDPTGAWWGLKSSADGKHEGFSIAVFGGEHADVPLEESAGETIATALVEQRFSAILDLSLLRKGQVNRFMAPFLETLYRLNRQAMHLFVDEADAIAPQRPFGEEARMLGALEDVVRRGGIRGIGTTLITQRPAVLNKNVLTQCEILCALRIVHHKDIDAIREWVAVHGDEELAKQMMASLPALPIGTAWFWAPGWGELFEQVKIRQRETFDSGATPKPGEKRQTAKVVAQVDLQKLGEQIRATVEHAKANDPKELKRKIAELERQLKTKPAAAPDDAAIKRAVDDAVRGIHREYQRQQSDNKALLERMKRGFSVIAKQCNKFVSVELPASTPAPMPCLATPAPHALPSPKPKLQAATGNGEHSLTGPEQRILNAIAWLNTIGVEEPEQTAVAFLAGYTYSGGAFNNPRGALNSNGLVQYVSGGRIRLTEEGKALAHPPDAPLDATSLQRMVLERLPGPEQKILTALLQAYPDSLSNEVCAQQSGYTPAGGAFNNPKGRLRSLGLVEYPERGHVKAKSLLFLEN